MLSALLLGGQTSHPVWPGGWLRRGRHRDHSSPGSAQEPLISYQANKQICHVSCTHTGSAAETSGCRGRLSVDSRVPLTAEGQAGAEVKPGLSCKGSSNVDVLPDGIHPDNSKPYDLIILS